MKKILYYSLVDWDWIKQRPQFLALGLAEQGFEVRAVYIKQYRKNGLQNIDPGKVRLCPIYRFPALGNRFPILNRINRWIISRKIQKEIRIFQPDILWVTHPSQLAHIPEVFAGTIVYDCMDNYDVLGTSPAAREAVCIQERELCGRADVILVSSQLLQQKIRDRNPDKANQIHLVRNGCAGYLYPRTPLSHGDKIYAGYVGTIAEWFDFDLLVESLERIPQLEYFLIGPIITKEPPVHQRIHYLGTVAHGDLFDRIGQMDCMIMPFILNEIVLSVDPVKLYEYISWQKPIVTVDYPEIQRFGGFVQTYADIDSYCAAIAQAKQTGSGVYSESEALDFLERNSWKDRVELIRTILCA